MSDSQNKRNSKTRSVVDDLGLDYSNLEDRLLLAVTVQQAGSELNIFGDTASNVVTVRQAGTSTLRVVSDGVTQNFGLSSISTVNFFGGNGNDVFTNFTSIDTNASGGDGDDTLTTGSGDDVLTAGNGNDTLTSSGGTNRLIGNNGNDDIFGGDGIDVIFSGNGNDTIFGGGGNDRLFGGSGNDSIEGQNGVDLLRGGDGDDVLLGGNDNDRILGERGDDEINGGNGVDRIFGNDDDDIVIGGSGNDFVRGGSGNDTLRGDQGNDNLRGGDGDDNLMGGDQVDRLAGDAGNDTLDGGTQRDRVFGDAGDDLIVSTSGDFIIGGTGDDTFDLSNQADGSLTFTGNFADYEITNTNGQLVVSDTRTSSNNDGLDLITGADSLRFADRVRTPSTALSDGSSALQTVYVQPIVVSDNNGSNTAEFFGNAEQSFEIQREIDLIYLQAGIDIEWLDATSINSTFINRGTGSGVRTGSDLREIINRGDSAGVGADSRLVIDAYFVEVVPQFTAQSNNVANGLAFVGDSGLAIHVGDNLVNFQAGREVVARVTAHEIAHNLGLGHVSDPDNLLANGDEINSSQRNTILNSSLSQNASGTIVQLGSSGEAIQGSTSSSSSTNFAELNPSSDSGGCGGCGSCASCTGVALPIVSNDASQQILSSNQADSTPDTSGCGGCGFCAACTGSVLA